MPHFEPDRSSTNPIAPDYNSSAPEVPPELGRLLQQLFVVLEDYMNVPPRAMANIAVHCEQAVSEIGETLSRSHWSQDDTLLLLNECVRRLKTDQHVADVDARAALLTTYFPGWITGR